MEKRARYSIQFGKRKRLNEKSDFESKLNTAKDKKSGRSRQMSNFLRFG